LEVLIIIKDVKNRSLSLQEREKEGEAYV